MCGPINEASHHHSTEASHSENIPNTAVPPDIHNMESSTNTMQEMEVPIILPQISRRISHKSSTKPATSTRTRIFEDLGLKPELPASSAVHCETSDVFKRPTSGAKRKRKSDNCSRKRTCPTKLSMISAVRLDKPKKEELIRIESTSCEEGAAGDKHIQQLTSFIDDDPDAMLVENILKYFKMPAFIEPIVDSEFIIQASNRSTMADECSLNDNLNSEVPSEPNPIELITYEEIESPASPPPFTDNASAYKPAIIIPTSSIIPSSLVKSILDDFDNSRSQTVKRRKYKMPSAEEEQILATTRNRMERYLVSEWTVNEIDMCYNDLSNIRPSILSKCIIEVTMNTQNENLSKEFTPPAPALPQSHQKIIVLIKRISRHIDKFEDLVLFQLEKTLFVLAGEKVILSEAINLTHLFIGLSDSMDEESKWSCVLFMYKCLYYYSIKATPLIYSVLMAYPTILPIFKEEEDINTFFRTTNNVLQAAFVIVLINTNFYEPVEYGNLKKKELQAFLKTYYHFPYMKPTIDDFVDNLVNRLTNNTNDLRNISYSLILLAKRKGTEWADDVIQQKLLPLLNNYLVTISNGTENDDRITTLVSAISSIVKTYPVYKEISNYHQIFCKMLGLTTRQAIQETAVMALLQTSRFGMVDVYRRICDWKPPFEVSRKCYLMLSTFLYRKNLRYWKEL